VPLTPVERAELIGPSRRLPEFETVTLSWVQPNPPLPVPPGPDWPVVASGAAGAAYSATVSEDGPFIVSEFLEQGVNNADLTAGLDRLEAELRFEARGREGYLGVTVLPDDANWTFPNLLSALLTPAAADVRNHLLRDTLLAALVPSGFPFYLPEVPLGLLPNDVFYRPIMFRTHMKDVLVGQDHGEWTHLLQWYLLATSSRLNTGSYAAEVFEYLGYQGVAQYTEPATSTRQGPNLWRVCCDRDAPYIHTNTSRAKDPNDFRCPDMLHVGLTGYAPIRGTGLENAIRNIGGAALASFTETRDAWKANSVTWPFLCALLRHRVLKREPLYQQAKRITTDLRAEVRALIEAALATVKADVANSDLDLFFLKDFFTTTPSGILNANWAHLTFPLGMVVTPAITTIVMDVLNKIRLDYGKIFYRSNTDAIAYGWTRLHRQDPSNMPAPPTDLALLASQFLTLPSAAQDELCRFSKYEFRP
jgi:hypothetical protein